MFSCARRDLSNGLMSSLVSERIKIFKTLTLCLEYKNERQANVSLRNFHIENLMKKCYIDYIPKKKGGNNVE